MEESARLVRAHPPQSSTRAAPAPASAPTATRHHAATGDYLLFLDDDACSARASWRQEGAFWTRAVIPSDGPRHPRAAPSSSGHTVVPNEQSLLGFQSRPYRQGEALRTVVINAALFPRELFDRVRFDPRLKYGLDEVDLTTQAVACGYRIVPCFEASNLHFPSALGREGYGEAAIAARLYVTLKRRRYTESSRLRGWAGFGLAAAHAYLAACRRYGPRAGTQLGDRTLKAAWRDYEKYKRGRGLSGEGTVA